MLLTITTTHIPATDLGFLLHKHPQRAQSVQVSAGRAHVFYPKADEDETTAALLLELDPIALVRKSRGTPVSVTGYVNDQPYAAGSQLAVALRAVFGTAMTGRCDARQDLADTAVPLRVRIPALSCGGDLDRVHRWFAPLGWDVRAEPVPLDATVPAWGDSRYVDLTLTGTLRLADALRQLYVLLPALEGSKHYWITAEEVDKLLRAGENWLGEHPERDAITTRYLARKRSYVDAALAALGTEEDADPLTEAAVLSAPEAPRTLAQERRGTVLAVLRAEHARRVLDLGCGGGALLRDLLAEPSFTEIVGLDVSARALQTAERTLERLPEHARHRVRLRQTALTYADPALAGYDAAVLMEVIEHLVTERLPALEHAVFTVARPRTVLVTTPNAEYNALFETLPHGEFRHADHRFEWTRATFADWAAGVAGRRGYRVRHLPVGALDPERGAPTQLAVFTRDTGSEVAA